jgi:hypothetical protein
MPPSGCPGKAGLQICQQAPPCGRSARESRRRQKGAIRASPTEVRVTAASKLVHILVLVPRYSRKSFHGHRVRASAAVCPPFSTPPPLLDQRTKKQAEAPHTGREAAGTASDRHANTSGRNGPPPRCRRGEAKTIATRAGRSVLPQASGRAHGPHRSEPSL